MSLAPGTKRRTSKPSRAAGRIEAMDFGAGGLQVRPCRLPLGRAEPVVNDADADTIARLGRQRLDEFAPDAIVGDDVAFEQHVALRVADRVEPRWKIFPRVDQQANRVAFGQGRPGGAREGAIETPDFARR